MSDYEDHEHKDGETCHDCIYQTLARYVMESIESFEESQKLQPEVIRKIVKEELYSFFDSYFRSHNQDQKEKDDTSAKNQE